jgi:hypothetical protein
MKSIYRFLIALALFAPDDYAFSQWVQTNGPYGGTVLSFAVSPNGAGGTNLFAGTSVGVFLSTNNGTSWTAVNTGLTNTYVNALAVSPNGAGGTNLFAGTLGGVFLSTNNGTSWTQSGLTVAYVTSFAVSPATGEAGGTNLFAGTWGGGVYLSTNNGTSWTQSGLTHTYVLSLAVSPATGEAGGTNLFAGTEGGGVWRRPLSEMIKSVERLSMPLPMQFRLEQNYPNPFNPSTTISFALPSRSFVSLKVFDALGREVAVLVFEELFAGTYSSQWNAEGLSSGVYFYCLSVRTPSGQAGSFTETKKLILLR